MEEGRVLLGGQERVGLEEAPVVKTELLDPEAGGHLDQLDGRQQRHRVQRGGERRGAVDGGEDAHELREEQGPDGADLRGVKRTMSTRKHRNSGASRYGDE